MKVTIEGKNRGAGFANAVGVELSDLDAKPILRIQTGNTTDTKRVVERVQVGRRQQLIVRLLLDPATIDYMVRIEGAVDFRPT